MRRFTLIFLLTAFLALAALGAPRYTDKALHFSFQPPLSWRKISKAGAKFIAFTGPTEQGIAPNVNIAAQASGGLTLDDYVLQNRKAFATLHNARIKAEKRATLDNVPAYQWDMSVELANAPDVLARQIFCVREKRAYALTFTAQPTDKKRYDALFAKIVASFRWEK